MISYKEIVEERQKLENIFCSFHNALFNPNNSYMDCIIINAVCIDLDSEIYNMR